MRFRVNTKQYIDYKANEKFPDSALYRRLKRMENLYQ